jgi:hypothetical protein
MSDGNSTLEDGKVGPCALVKRRGKKGGEGEGQFLRFATTRVGY